MGIDPVSISLITAGIGLGTQAYSAKGQYSANKRQAQASQEAEAARAKQMELQAERDRREIIRKAQLARSTALQRTTAQTGSSATVSSALPGSYGQIAGQEGSQLEYLQSALGIGRDIFSANARGTQAGSDAAFYQGVGSFGKSLTANAETIGKIGTNIFGSSRYGEYTVDRNAL